MPAFALMILVSEGCLNRGGLAATLGVSALFLMGAAATFALLPAHCRRANLWARFLAGFTAAALLESYRATVAYHFSGLTAACHTC